MVTAVCQYIAEGKPASEVQRLVKARYDIDLKREDPYRLLSYAAAKGWIHVQPQPEIFLGEQIRLRHKWLEGVHVVHTSVAQDVARQGAVVLRDLLQDRRQDRKQNEVHVGFAGGPSM